MLEKINRSGNHASFFHATHTLCMTGFTSKDNLSYYSFFLAD
jgi:hypothetical protein